MGCDVDYTDQGSCSERGSDIIQTSGSATRELAIVSFRN
jgi:hypothetical protein